MPAATRFAARAVVLAAMLTWPSLPAHAQIEQQLIWCNAGEPTPDQRVEGCTAVIASGLAKGADLARAFNRRGFAYHVKGDMDRAIQDYDQAIRLDPKVDIPFYNRGLAL